MFLNIPKTVGIIVKGAENLEYTVPGSKKSAKTWRWGVVFKGAKEKMATEFVDAANGCPVWDCEVTLDLVSPADPLAMLVLDGKRRHIGQVVVPLSQISHNGPPNFDPSRLQYSELEPTKKNSMPRGRLVYWIWAISYWPPGTDPSVMSKPKSLRGSLSNLGHGSKSKHNKLPDTNPADRDYRYGSADPASSTISGAAPSMLSVGSFPDSHSSETNWAGGGNSGLPPSGGSPAIRGPYNPMAGYDDEGMSTVSGGSQPYLAGRPPIYQQFNVNAPSGGSSDDKSSVRIKGRRRILDKMKKGLSRSTQNLAKIAGGHKVYGEGSVISTGKNDARLCSPGSVYGSELNPGDDNGSVKAVHAAKEKKPMRPTLSSLRSKNHSLLPNPAFNGQKQLSPRPSGIGLASPVVVPTPTSPSGANNDRWGLHPEERPHKPLEDMSHREIKEYAMRLENSCQTSRAEATRLLADNVALEKHAITAEGDLTDVRITLANLRNRLLQDNLTEYLENPADTNGGASCINFGTRGSVPRGSIRRTMSAANMAGIGLSNGGGGGQPPQSTAQSFLAKLSAIGMGAQRRPGNSVDTGFLSTTPAVVEPTDEDMNWW